jgi:hypothetical protein
MKSIRISIAQDSKLADVLDELKHPVEYVRNVLAALNMLGGGRNSAVRVRLSLQSNRTAPDYQIVEIMDVETGQPMELAAYSGRTHKELPNNDKNASIHWSDDGCNFVEVQAIIGALRKATKS